MSRLTRDGTAEPVSRDQILRHARGQGNIHFPCSADHEQDWQPYPVDPYSAICDDHTYIHTHTTCLIYTLLYVYSILDSAREPRQCLNLTRSTLTNEAINNGRDFFGSWLKTFCFGGHGVNTVVLRLVGGVKAQCVVCICVVMA